MVGVLEDMSTVTRRVTLPDIPDDTIDEVVEFATVYEQLALFSVKLPEPVKLGNSLICLRASSTQASAADLALADCISDSEVRE